MGNQGQDETKRNPSNQQQGGGGQRNDRQQGGSAGSDRQQEQQGARKSEDSPRTPDEIGQGDLDAGSIGSDSNEKEGRDRQRTSGKS